MLNGIFQGDPVPAAGGNRVGLEDDPVPAAGAYDKLLTVSPVPFLFLNAAGQATPVPDYGGLLTAPTNRLLESTQAYDDANKRPGDFMMGVFRYPPGAGFSPGPRVGVADASPITNGSSTALVLSAGGLSSRQDIVVPRRR